MSTAAYLRAELDGEEFAVPASSLAKILPNPISAALPDAPGGICGIAYDAGAVYAIRSFDAARHAPAELVVLCEGESGRAAYAANRVHAMGELTEDELDGACPAGDMGILILGGRERHD